MKKKVTGSVCVLLCILLGCQPVIERQLAFEEEAAEVMINCVLDVTGSFLEEMFGDSRHEGKAFKTFLQVNDRFFRDRQDGSKDRFIVTRISGSKKALLIDAEPHAFHQRFPSAESFKEFVLSQPDPGGSRVYDSLRDTMDYMILQHRSARKLKSMVLAWTDMDNNRSDSPRSKELLIQSLKAYAAVGGAIGLYGVEVSVVPEWSRVLADAGFKQYVIEPDVRENPKLPLF
jgi:hypothetical protein